MSENSGMEAYNKSINQVNLWLSHQPATNVTKNSLISARSYSALPISRAKSLNSTSASRATRLCGLILSYLQRDKFLIPKTRYRYIFPHWQGLQALSRLCTGFHIEFHFLIPKLPAQVFLLRQLYKQRQHLFFLKTEK